MNSKLQVIPTHQLDLVSGGHTNAGEHFPTSAFGRTMLLLMIPHIINETKELLSYGAELYNNGCQAAENDVIGKLICYPFTHNTVTQNGIINEVCRIESK